jgi:hypothetical protein
MSNRIGSKRIGLLAAALMAIPLTAGVAAPTHPPRAVFTITNASSRFVECTLVRDGDTWSYLKVPIGQTYTEEFRHNRRIQLVCMRGFEHVYGPLKLGVAYRFVDRGRSKVAIVSPDGGDVPWGPS